MIAGQLEIQMSMALARLSNDMQQARTLVDRGMNNISRSVDVAKKALGALGIGFGLREMERFVMASIDAADAMNDMAQKVGINVQTLASYQLAVEQSGGSLDSFGVGMKNLSVYMAKHSGDLRSLGVTSKDTGAAFNQLAEVFHAMPDGYLKTALAQEIFKKSGVEMIPMLNLGAAGLEQAAAKSELYAQRMAIAAPISDQFNDSLAELKISYSGLIALSTVPVFNELINEMVEARNKADGLRSSFDPLGETIKALVILGGNFVYTFSRIGNIIGSTAAQINAHVHGNYDEFRAITKMIKEDDERALKDFNAWEAKILAIKTGINAIPTAAPGGIDKTAEQIKALEAATRKLLAAGDDDKKLKKKQADADFILQYETELIVKKAREEQAWADYVLAYETDLIVEKWQKEQVEAEKFAAQQKKDYEELNRTLTDALMRGFESGSSFAQNFVNTVQNMFNTLVLRPVVSAIMSPVSLAISAGASGLGLSNMAGASGLIGAEMGGYSMAQGALYYQGGGTVAGAYAGSTAAGIGATAAAVAPYAAAAAAAYVIGKYGFGWGNERENVGAQRLAGTFNRSGFSGSYLQDWKVEGGLFGGGSSGTDAIPLSALQNASYRALVAGLQKTFDTLGVSIGDAGIRTQQWTVKVNMAGDVTGTLADGMASQLIPALQDLRIEGENLAQTAQRVTDAYSSTTQLISGLGLSEGSAFGAIGIASADARLALVDAAGGLQNFGALAGQFASSILDPAQRLQISLDSVGISFARLGIAGIETNKQFSALVASELQLGHYDVVTELLGVSSAFAEISKSAEETTRQLLDLIKQDTFGTMVDYQRAIGRAANMAAPGNTPLDMAVASSAAQLPRLQAANDSYNEIVALRQEVAGLRLSSEQNAQYSKRIADLLRNVTQDGQSLMVTQT